jgi:hypothetical protein
MALRGALINAGRDDLKVIGDFGRRKVRVLTGSEQVKNTVHCADGTLIRCAHFKENRSMALRSRMLTKELDAEEPAPEQFSQRRKPDIGQFRLQVDRQTKASFTTLEAAEAAGLVIKKRHPVVRVTAYDAVECTSRTIEVPPA